MRNGGAVLFNHDFDELIGIVEQVSMDSDRVGRATVRISSTANDEWEMIQEGILNQVSIGYNINNYRIEGNNLYVTDYEIYEISFVSVAADPTVGIGRSHEINNNNNIIQGIESNMEDENKVEITEEVVITDEVIEEVVTEAEVESTEVEVIAEPVLEESRSLTTEDVINIINEHREIEIKLNKESAEVERVNELRSIGEVLKVNVDEAIDKGLSIEEFKRSLKEKENTPVINKEVKMEKNLIKDMIRAIKTGDHSVLDQYERGAKGYMRAITGTDTTTAAGALNEDLQDQYIPELLKLSTLGQLNTTVYSGLYGRGSLAIPKAAGVSPIFRTYAENEAQDDSAASFTKVVLTPTAFGGAIPLSKQAILLAPNIENFVQAELMRYAAQGLEQWVMDKIVAAAPVLNTAAATITLADVEAAVAQLGSANVDVRAAKAVMNSKTLAKLRQVAILDNTAAKAAVEGYRSTEMWLCDEVPVVVSEFVEDDQILIGEFSNVLIGQWVNSEYDYDDTTYRSSNTVVYRVWDYLDVQVAHAEAFVNLTIASA